MIPLRDNIPSRTTPIVNYAIVAICTLAFLVQWSAGDGGQRIIEQYGMIPARVNNFDAATVIQEKVAVRTPRGIEVGVVERAQAPSAVSPWLTIVTCMFLHGGWMHFLGNMWFLYIFGDNVEDRLGHLGFLVMYIVTGIAAGMSHLLSAPASVVPTIGASGAIAGVMGAYAWLYPHARVQAVLPLLVVMPVFVVPAPVFLGIWFVFQTYSGLMASSGGEATGVAWWAHIGGFVAGALAAVLVGRTPLGHKPVEARRF